MKTTNEKVYRCDFCNKAMVSAGFMKVHERMCKKNPNNKHQCFKYCAHLVKDDGVETRTDDYGHEWNVGGLITFCCKMKDGLEMYSYKLERYKTKLNERLSDYPEMVRMPLSCELYEPEKGHDFSEETDMDDLYDLKHDIF